MINGNVITFDPATFYCMRQCKESIKHCLLQNNPVYDVEIAGETALFRDFMKEVLTPRQEAA